MSSAIFIDGGHGTTGLEIRERLAGRDDLSLIDLDATERRDDRARAEAMRAADIAILCLPDNAAREAAALAGQSDTRVIDASTAHRTAHDWVYGFAELDDQQPRRIAEAQRVANPGCYALSFIALVRPLVRAGLVGPETPIAVNATSGYSGGGRAMIEEFEQDDPPTAYHNYALDLAHKHLSEMTLYAGLSQPPLFSPSVANCYRGMLVELALPRIAGLTPANVRAALERHYRDSATIAVAPHEETAALSVLAIERCAGTDRLEIHLFASADGSQLRLCAVLDNLGKGAAGSAVQNLNLMTEAESSAGLKL